MQQNEPASINTEQRANGSRLGGAQSILLSQGPEEIEPLEATCAVTLILPAYNEAAALPLVLTSLADVLSRDCEVIVVDDGSTDETAAIARGHGCRVLQHKHNYGKGAAVQSGLLAARGQFIIIMDADNTYPASAIPMMIELSEQYEFVRCLRRDGLANSPVLNRVGNMVFDSLLHLVYGLEGGDYLSGLYGLRREAIDALQLSARGFDLEIEIAIKARARRLRSMTLPIAYTPRLGEKKLRPWIDGWFILRQIGGMALIHNPGLTFVLPGLLIWSLAAILTVILSQGSVITPYVGRLDVNSFIVAALGATIGFQFIVFGIAAAVFGVECGARPRPWLVALSRGRVRFWAAMLGILFAVIGAAELSSIVGHWVHAGGGPFGATRRLVFSGMLLSWGLQVVLAALFISIFAGRLEKADRALAVGLEQLQVENTQERHGTVLVSQRRLPPEHSEDTSRSMLSEGDAAPQVPHGVS